MNTSTSTSAKTSTGRLIAAIVGRTRGLMAAALFPLAVAGAAGVVAMSTHSGARADLASVRPVPANVDYTAAAMRAGDASVPQALTVFASQPWSDLGPAAPTF